MTGRTGRRSRRAEAASLVALVAKRDYVRTVRRRGFVFGTLLLPLSIAGFFFISSFASGELAPGGGGTDFGPRDVALLVVNESDLALAPSVLTPHVRLVERGDGLARLGAGQADELYVVPDGYPTDATVLRFDASDSDFAIDALQRQAAQLGELGLLLQSALLATSDVPPETVARVMAPIGAIDAQTTTGEPVVAGPSLGAFLLPFGFTMLFVLSIFITSGYLLQSVTEEKENRVVEIVLSSVPALPLMAGKIVGLGAAGLTQVIIWALSAVIAAPLLGDRLGDVSSVSLSPITLGLAMLYFALGYLAYGAMFSAVGALAPGSREAQQYAGVFGFAAVVPLIFAGIFLADPQSPLITALALIPFTTPATMLLVLTLTPEVPWLLVVASLVSLSVFTLVATVASARVFRATLLLYGVRPSVSQMISAVFARG